MTGRSRVGRSGRIGVLLVTSLAIVPACPTIASEAKFEGASVYMAGEFVKRDLVVRDGVVVREAGAGAVAVPLSGAWVIPAMGDAHTHRFTDADAAAKDMFVSAGILYVQNLNGNSESRLRSRRDCNTPQGPDAQFANAGFTCTGGHPVPLYTSLDGYNKENDPATVMDRIADFNFYVTDSVEQVSVKWPKFARSGADGVKLFLLHSERWSQPDGAEKSSGLRAEVAEAIAARAKQAGLRLYAHIESAQDAALAVRCGVDLLGHMPGYAFKTTDDPLVFTATDELIAEAARSGTAMTPTLGLLYADPNDTAGAAKIRAWKRAQVARWKDGGVQLLHGSDNYFDVQSEIKEMIASNIWTNAELIEMLAVRTPRWIFPGRSVGSLEPGSEGSFVVLGANPLEDAAALLDIRAVYKDGVAIWTAPPKAGP